MSVFSFKSDFFSGEFWIFIAYNFLDWRPVVSSDDLSEYYDKSFSMSLKVFKGKSISKK